MNYSAERIASHFNVCYVSSRVYSSPKTNEFDEKAARLFMVAAHTYVFLNALLFAQHVTILGGYYLSPLITETNNHIAGKICAKEPTETRTKNVQI